jgi:hypothetical protein
MFMFSRDSRQGIPSIERSWFGRFGHRDALLVASRLPPENGRPNL